MRLKAHILTLLMVCSVAFMAKGQSFEEGNSVVSVGYGFPNLGKTILKAIAPDDKITGIGPLHIKYEYALSDKIGLGATFNFVNYGAEWTSTDPFTDSTYSYDTEVSGWSFLPRLNIHFANTDKIDPYWGIGVGYKNTSFKFESTEAGWDDKQSVTIIPVGFETTLGLRFYFTDNIGAFMEVGIAKSVIQGGLVAKF